MEKLFMKYPIGLMIDYDGSLYEVMGYEIYNDRQYLICREEDMVPVRIHAGNLG